MSENHRKSVRVAPAPVPENHEPVAYLPYHHAAYLMAMQAACIDPQRIETVVNDVMDEEVARKMEEAVRRVLASRARGRIDVHRRLNLPGEPSFDNAALIDRAHRVVEDFRV